MGEGRKDKGEEYINIVQNRRREEGDEKREEYCKNIQRTREELGKGEKLNKCEIQRTERKGSTEKDTNNNATGEKTCNDKNAKWASITHEESKVNRQAKEKHEIRQGTKKKEKQRRGRRKRVYRKKGKKVENTLKIAYNNLQGKARQEYKKIKKLITNNDWDITCFTESSERTGDKWKDIEGFRQQNSRRDENQSKGGGIKVITKASLQMRPEYAEVKNINDSERTWVVTEKPRKIAVCTIYMRAEGSKDQSLNEGLVEQIITEMVELQEAKYNIILVGDFNGHIEKDKNGEWKNKNKNGAFLLQIVKAGALHIVNDSSKCSGKWTWMKRNQKSQIDFFLVDQELIPLISQMTIDESGEKWSVGSDHNFMTLEIRLPKVTAIIKDKTQQWNIHEKSNWEMFRSGLKDALGNWNKEWEENVREGDDSWMYGYQNLINIMKGMGEKAIGYRRFNNKKEGYNPSTLQRRRNRAAVEWRKANKEDSSAVMEKWRRYLQLSKKVKAQRKQRENTKAGQRTRRLLNDPKLQQQEVWRKLKDKKGSEEVMCIEKDGIKWTDGPDLKRVIEEYMSEQGLDQCQSNAACRMEEDEGGDREILANLGNTPNIRKESTLTKEITVKETISAIAKLKRKKAIGIDNIPNEFILEGGQMLVECLTMVFNEICTNKQTPSSWGEETVTLLHKGKSKTNLDNYRSIAITSNVGKVFTRIMGHRLSEKAEQEGWIREEQNGFRKERSTADNLFCITAIMELAKKKKKPLYLGFIDLRKAYDRVNREKLWKCLCKLGLDKESVQMLRQLYSVHKRKVFTTGGWTEWINCQIGVKQGCVLSPILFSLFIHDIVESVNMYGGWVAGDRVLPGLLFADDLVIIAGSEVELKLKLQKLSEYIDRKNLQINIDKSEIMRLNDNHNEEKLWEMYSREGEVIGEMKENNVYKYMGVRLGSGRRFLYQKRHSQSWLPRTVGLFNARSRSIARDVISQSKLWQQVQKPGILYGSNVICYDKGWIKSLESTQHKIGCKILGVPRTSSYTGIRGELGWTTLEGEIKLAKLRYKGKVMHMDKERWPAVIYRQILECPTEWLEEVVKVENMLGVNQGDYVMYKWRQVIQTKYRNWEQQEWKNQVKNSKSLRYYPKDTLFGLGRFVDGSDDGKRLTKFRIGNLGKHVADEIQCTLCKRMCDQMVLHLIQECSVTKDTSIKWIKLVNQKANRNNVPQLIKGMVQNMNKEQKSQCIIIMKKLETERDNI